MVSACFLRKAVQGDEEAMAYVHATSWKETYKGLLDDHAISRYNVEHRKKMWTKFLNSPIDSQKAYVATVADRVVGIASWVDRNEYVELLALYVLNEFQRKGVGTSLFRQVEEDATKRGKHLITWVLNSNKATLFYEKMALTLVKTEEKMLGDSIVQEAMFSNEREKWSSPLKNRTT